VKSTLMRLPQLDALRGFAAARRLNITAASQDLCVAQSAGHVELARSAH
jgi:hypothetical protein